MPQEHMAIMVTLCVCFGNHAGAVGGERQGGQRAGRPGRYTLLGTTWRTCGSKDGRWVIYNEDKVW